VSRLRISFDMMTVARQLGLMPTPGSTAEHALVLAQKSASWVQQTIQKRRH